MSGQALSASWGETVCPEGGGPPAPVLGGRVRSVPQQPSESSDILTLLQARKRECSALSRSGGSCEAQGVLCSVQRHV